MEDKTNLLPKRCITVSKKHDWRDMRETLEYLDLKNRNLSISQYITEVKHIRNKDGKLVVKCIFCGLVDDLYGGKYE